MRVEFSGLLVTLLLGIFILIGSLMAFLVKKRQKVIDFSLGLAFSVIVMLIIFDIIPEIIDNLSISYIFIFIIGSLLGYQLLKTLDSFIPNHENDKMTNNELKNNLVHIGIVSSIALIMHNFIEGMTVYSVVISDVSLGLLIGIGVGLHNLAFGMVIVTTFYQANQNRKKILLLIATFALSTLFGGLFMFILGIKSLNGLVLGLLLSITLGMLLYIIFNELYERVKNTKNKESRNLGLLIGIIIFLISVLI